jgi:mannose-1-phosphate guanylyltransferase
MKPLTNGEQPSNRISNLNPIGADTHGADCWAVILAGGDGTRLRPLTRMISGDERPKQFCALLGDETLLNQTMRRTALTISPNRTLLILTETHERFYASLLADLPRDSLVIQPKNAGTAPAILYTLLRMSKIAPSSAAAFFPSDHYFSDDAVFMAQVETAFEIVRGRDDLVVLLGIEPEWPEPSYGWIEPVSSESAKKAGALWWVRRFWEKPAPELARELMERGCLWNSFVMVGRVSAFLKMIRHAAPELYASFAALEPALHTHQEEMLVRKLYSRLDDVNFSQHVLAAHPPSLAVLRVGGMKWSDLGEPQRALSVMVDIGLSSVAEQFRALAAASGITLK